MYFFPLFSDQLVKFATVGMPRRQPRLKRGQKKMRHVATGVIFSGCAFFSPLLKTSFCLFAQSTKRSHT